MFDNKNNKGASSDGDPKQAPRTVDPVVAEELRKLDAESTPAIPAIPSDTNALMSLVQTLLESTKIAAAREARLAKAEDEEAARKQARADQYARNRMGEDTSVTERQKVCKHLKGGKHRKRGSEKDYAVFLHRFIDNTQYVKCMLCKMKWYPTDTVERIVRGGKVLLNHTGIGWREALLLMEDSTNTPSMSEIPQSMWSNIQKAEDIPNSTSVITR